jgi:hypothetical protein
MSLLGGKASDRAAQLLGKKWGRRACVFFATGCAATLLLVGPRIENSQLAICVLALGAGFNGFAAVSWWAVTIDVSRDYSGSISGPDEHGR